MFFTFSQTHCLIMTKLLSWWVLFKKSLGVDSWLDQLQAGIPAVFGILSHMFNKLIRKLFILNIIPDPNFFFNFSFLIMKWKVFYKKIISVQFMYYIVVINNWISKQLYSSNFCTRVKSLLLFNVKSGLLTSTWPTFMFF